MGKKNDLTCKTGLKKGIIDQDIFQKELSLCKMLSSQNNQKCGWGKCENCGVIPLLYKLHKGELIENPEELKKIKDELLK